METYKDTTKTIDQDVSYELIEALKAMVKICVRTELEVLPEVKHAAEVIARVDL